MPSAAGLPRGIVVGLGTMGSLHARVLGQLSGAELVAAVDPSAEHRARFEQRAPGVPTFESLEHALSVVEAEFACVATPAGVLASLGRQAMDAGLAVLVEKPLAEHEDDARTLVEDAERRGALLSVGHVERCNPAVIALKQRLDEGFAGEIFQMHARRLSPFPDRDSMLGVSLDLATHDIDVMRYLSGQEVERVFAETARRVHDRAEDLIAATLRLDGGCTGLLEVNWLTPAKVREITVTAEAGTFVLNYLTQELFFYERPTKSTEWSALASIRGAGEGNMIRYALQRREPLMVEWEAFLEALATGSPPLVTGRDGYAAMSTARAIQRAGSSHETTVPGYRAAAAVAG